VDTTRRITAPHVGTSAVVAAALAVAVGVTPWSPASGVQATLVTPDVPLYRRPLDPPTHVLRGFDPPPRPWLAGHRGVDLSAADGATVRSPASGVVTFSGDVAGRGVVTVLHGDGRRSSLEPVTASVVEGTRVAAGDPLGTLTGDAHGGVPGGPALHWGVREDDRYVDPWDLLAGTGPVVLLAVPHR